MKNYLTLVNTFFNLTLYPPQCPLGWTLEKSLLNKISTIDPKKFHIVYQGLHELSIVKRIFFFMRLLVEIFKI